MAQSNSTELLIIQKYSEISKGLFIYPNAILNLTIPLYISFSVKKIKRHKNMPANVLALNLLPFSTGIAACADVLSLPTLTRPRGAMLQGAAASRPGYPAVAAAPGMLTSLLALLHRYRHPLKQGRQEPLQT